MSAIVLRGDQVIAQGVAGVRKNGSSERITLEDRFEISSCAKAMTATLVAMLAEEGKLDWDAPLSKIFADAEQPIDAAWEHITLRHVLAHRAGVRDRITSFLAASLFGKEDAKTERQRFAMKLLRRRPSTPPGTTYVYSNAGYILAAAALEKITGSSWEDLMRHRLFAPLGITTGGFGPPGTAGLTDQPWGHGRRRLAYIDLLGTGSTAYDPGSSNADYPLMWAPVGLVHMSVPDWARFVALHLRGDRANPQHLALLLTRESFASLHESANDSTYVGGWMLGTRSWAKGARPGDTGRVLFHAGDNGRWNSVVWVAPEIDFAILISSNRARSWSAVDEVASVLVRTLVPAQ